MMKVLLIINYKTNNILRRSTDRSNFGAKAFQ